MDELLETARQLNNRIQECRQTVATVQHLEQFLITNLEEVYAKIDAKIKSLGD